MVLLSQIPNRTQNISPEPVVVRLIWGMIRNVKTLVHCIRKHLLTRSKCDRYDCNFTSKKCCSLRCLRRTFSCSESFLTCSYYSALFHFHNHFTFYHYSFLLSPMYCGIKSFLGSLEFKRCSQKIYYILFLTICFSKTSFAFHCSLDK